MKKLSILIMSLVLLLGMSVSSFGEASEDMVLLPEKEVETLLEVVKEQDETIDMQHKTIESLLDDIRSLTKKNKILEDKIKDLRKRIFVFRELGVSKQHEILWYPAPGFGGCPGIFNGVALYDKAVSMTLVE